MKNSVLLLVLSFLLSNIVFAQFGRISKVFNIDDEFNHNEMLLPLIENNNLDKELLEFWRIDSMVTYLAIDETDSVAFGKSINTYFDSNNTIEYVYLSKNPDNEEWENKSKSILIFNENRQQVQSFLYQGVDQEWVLRDRTDYTYNNEDMVVIKTRFIWDSNENLWLNGHKTEFEYNEFELVICELHYKPDNETNNWQYFYKYDFIFNTNEFLEKKITSFWDLQTLTWDFSYKKVFTLEDGVDSDYSYTWDSMGWSPVSKNVGYRIDSYTVAHNGFTFSSNTGWLNDTKSEARYDIFGNLTLYESFNYSTSNNMWIGHRKYNNIYNENGQNIMNINYDWRTEVGGWIISYKEQSGYNDIGLRYYYGTFGWLESEKRWVKNWSILSFYSNPSSIFDNNIEYLTINIYPNPCINEITINYDANSSINAVYTICSLSGNIVDKGIIKQGNTINVDELNAGYYLLFLKTGVKQYSGKFLKL